jgi:hypothetical protein
MAKILALVKCWLAWLRAVKLRRVVFLRTFLQLRADMTTVLVRV